jgi:hypothetical protein
MPIVRIESAEFLVGMELRAAQQTIADHGYECRVVWRDGRTLVPDYKPDYDPLRVNLNIKAGKVTKAVVG